MNAFQSKLFDQVPHMAPSNTRRSTRNKRKQAPTSSEESSCTIDDGRESDRDIIVGCSTPKAQRFRIPEILSCPPAPMKRRVTTKCSSKESPMVFFAPPDIELFFLFAFHNNNPA
uniref:Cyclin-dependent protein kinase inhibitor SMR13 n=1 Tax=Salix viminalis TaxID=40686 RepID=A0A6N2N5M8_SALVM